MKYIQTLSEKGKLEWQDSDAPDANGRFKDLSPKDLAAWLIKTRKGDMKKISGSLSQQVAFNKNDDPEYAKKMDKTRKEVYKQLDREDLLESVDMDDLDNAKEQLSNPHTILDITYDKTRRGDKFVRFDYENKYVPGKMLDSGPHFVNVRYDSNKDLKKISKELGMDLKESVLNEEDTWNDYPAAAKKNAQKAIDWKEEHGRDEVDAGTPVGWARAHQLAKGENLSTDTVKRMSAFNRHRKNSSIKPELKETPWKDRGYVAWLIWGGDEGVDWAIEKSKEIDAMKESKQLKYIKPLNEAEKYITDEFKVGDKIKTNFGEWEVIETDYAPNKSFIAPFIFKGKDMKRVPIPNPPKTNKNAVGYKVTDGDKYPIIGFLYQYKDITKLATVGVDESVVTEGKIKYAKGKTYQSEGHWTVVVDSNSSGLDIRVNHSAGWRLDPHDEKEETFELLDNGRQRATLYFKSGNIDKFAKQMFDLNDRTTHGNATKLTAKDYGDILRVWIDMRMANESVNEAVKPIKLSGNLNKDLKAVTAMAEKMVKYAKDNFNTYIPTGEKLSQLELGGTTEEDVLKYNINHLAKAINKDLTKKYMKDFVAESVNEASRRKVHKAAKQGSYPAVIVVVQDGDVIHQEPVSTPDVAPATFNVMQERYPKAVLHLEDNTGKRLFSESVAEGIYAKESKIVPGEYIKTQYGYFYKRVEGKVGGQDAYVEIKKGKEGKRKTSIHDTVDFDIVDKSVALGESVTEGMSKSAIKKAIKVIDQQIEDEEGGDGEPLDNETLQALEQERERLLKMNESKFSPLGYAKRVISGEISLKAAMKEAGISFSNISKLIKQIDKSFDLDAAVAENRKYIKSLNEGYWSSYDYEKWTKENGKPKYPKWVKVTLKEIVKGGFMDPVYDDEHNYMVLWLASLETKRRSEMYAYDKKGIKEFGKVGYAMYQRFYNDLTGYNMFFMQGAMYALEVSKHIQDRIANGEAVEPAYYMMKEYFNGFGMKTDRSRVFNAAYEKLEKWMKDNQIKTL